MKYRKLRIAFSAVCGILCLLLIALWVLHARSSKPPKSQPSITFDTQTKGTLAEFVPSLGDIAEITLTTHWTKELTSQLSTDEWQNLLQLFADTTPVRVHQDLTSIGDIHILTKDEVIIRVCVYVGSATGPVYRLHDGKAWLDYFVPVKNMNGILDILPKGKGHQ
jgi:hypothetical protein